MGEEKKPHSLKTASTCVYRGSYFYKSITKQIRMPAQKHTVTMLRVSMQIEMMALKNNMLAYLFRSILAIHGVYLMP